MLSGLGATLLTTSGATGAATGATIGGLTVVGKDGWLFPVWDQVRRVDFDKLHRVTHTITSAMATLAAAGIDTAIVLIPTKSRVYHEFLPDDVRMPADAERRYGAALADLAISGSAAPDLASLFAALRKADPQTDLYFRADTHWTTAGSEPAAAESARQIKLKSHLPPSPVPGATLGPAKTVQQPRNDLAALLPPAEQPKYPLQHYPLRSPIASSAESGLLDSEAADVMVIGNSFMQPAFGFASMLSNQLGRPVALTWKVHQFSPYWLLLNYLRSDMFKAKRPRLIVWNFQEPDMDVGSDDSGAWGPNAMSPASFLADLPRALGG